jgi:hypothetical protein
VIGQRPTLPREHPLWRLEQRRFAGGRLRVVPGPTSRFGALYFSLYLERDGSTSREPLLVALHHSGPYASYNWIEVAQSNDHLTLEAGGSTSQAVLTPADLRRLMALLGELIPSGGHLMLEYESPRWALTARALNLGAPPAATELGELLRAAGCDASIRNWDISEGGREGPRKLQGFKPLDERHADAARQARDRELKAFLLTLKSSTQPDALADARRRAARLLRSSPS